MGLNFVAVFSRPSFGEQRAERAMELENLSKRLSSSCSTQPALPRLPKRGEALILASRTFEKQPRDDNNMTSRLMGETFCMSLPYGSQYPLHTGCIVVVCSCTVCQCTVVKSRRKYILKSQNRIALAALS